MSCSVEKRKHSISKNKMEESCDQTVKLRIGTYRSRWNSWRKRNQEEWSIWWRSPRSSERGSLVVVCRWWRKELGNDREECWCCTMKMRLQVKIRLCSYASVDWASKKKRKKTISQAMEEGRVAETDFYNSTCFYVFIVQLYHCLNVSTTNSYLI